MALPLRGPGTISTTPIATASPTLRQATVFSTAQGDTRSYLRFFNTGAAAGSVDVTLYNGVTGAKAAAWTSPSIPVNAALEVPVATLESAGGVTTKPAFYVAAVAPRVTGSFQHIVYRASADSFANLSACDTGLTTNAGKLAHVHSSAADATFPSTLVFYNAAATSAAATVGLYDARTGARLGAYATPAIPAGGQVMVGAAALEAGARITPGTSIRDYTVKLESAFTGTVQHLLNNQAAGVLADMTAACPLK